MIKVSFCLCNVKLEFNKLEIQSEHASQIGMVTVTLFFPFLPNIGYTEQTEDNT